MYVTVGQHSVHAELCVVMRKEGS